MSEKIEHGKYGFLIDASLCIDCRSCLVACTAEHQIPMNSTRIWMKDTGVMGRFPDLSRYSAPFHCMHCDDPSCVSACTVGALKRNEDGIVVYDAKRCIGCRYCMYACPFDVPNMNLSEQLPLIIKCDMCEERLEEGLEPACAATCLTGAIQFGDRDQMLDWAKQQVEKNPELSNHIFGKEENGGTSTFYITPVDYEDLQFPKVDMNSSAFSNRQITHTTPAVAGTAVVALSGIYLAAKQLNKDNDHESDSSETTGESD